ncbi:hypothetical protein LPJ61_006028 [Coemansia biformis]|uniref:Gag1-like clamp domain-containing protein n=1 Tax=Coemansia biformis TaxID=1286918 RepID=A0A9W7XYX2_9FUNG|nr:hypothetical protein LPJ61_006028 [Coemansia biformis]
MVPASAEIVGREHWLRQNRQWRDAAATSGGDSCSTGCFPLQPKPLSAKNYDYVYRRLVVDRRPLRKPLPLTDVFPVIVFGWKKAGVWPADPTPAGS